MNWKKALMEDLNEDYLFEMVTLRKFSSQLPANLYLDDSMSYKGHPKRIKFQPNKGEKPITRNFLEMCFDGDIKSLNSPTSLKYLKLKSKEVNEIRQFVFNNKEALEILADMDIEIEDFKKIMITGGEPATPEQREQFLLNLEQVKKDFINRKKGKVNQSNQ